MADNLGERRSRRSNTKSGSARQKALDKIKKHRETGEKIEYAVEETDDLYELVDEDKYAQIVQERQEDNFIVDDDGAGYADHGREVFDEDPNEDPPPEALKDKNHKQSKQTKSAKITNLFNNATIKKKKKENTVTNEGDADLEDILNSIKATNPSSGNKIKVKKTDTRTPKRLNKHPPRRLEDSGKKIMLKTKSHVVGTRKSSEYKTPEIKNVKVENEDLEEVESFDIDEIEDQHIDASTELISSNDQNYSQESGICSQQSVKKEEKDDLLEDDLDVDMIADENTEQKNVKSQPDAEEEFNINDMFDGNINEEPLPNIDLSSAGLPTKKVDGIDILRFFWIDAYEDRFNQPGTVFLFGKVWIEASKCYVSCCVSVKNINRQMYILPRNTRHDKNNKDLGTPVTLKDVYDEFNDIITAKYGIKEFKCRQIDKKYAFEKANIPSEAKYLEVLYSANQPQLPNDLKGETIENIFGTNTSSLELLFLNQKLHGPSWIDIKYPQVAKQPMSWCKVEAFVDRPSFVTVVEGNQAPPPLTVLSLSMLTMNHHKKHSHEIISLCGLVHRDIHLDKGAPSQHFQQNFCFVTKPSDSLLPFDFTPTVQKNGANINISPNERSMLGLFLARVQAIDPDVIVGHDVHGFDIDVLLHRFATNKVPHWSKISRLKRSQLPKSVNSSKQSNFSEKFVTCGRLVCDIKISCKELIRCKSYDLSELVSVVLNKSREEILPEDVPKKFLKTKSLLNMIHNTRMDAMQNLQIMYELNVLPLAYQITGICGNTMSRTLLGGRSERNEFLLLHAFSKKDYILPDKSYGNKKTPQLQSEEHDGEHDETTSTQKRSQGRKKPAYTGGLVLEPKKGFYDKYILLLDFNSLYPSIIQEYNICFTTISLQGYVNGAKVEDEMPDVPAPGQEAGILPTEIRMLVERRKQVKKLLKTVAVGSDSYMQYDIRQKALKLTANSMYGCLGFSHSRFYAKPLAALVTGKGREILMKTKDLASNLGLDVIYGDTDSIMINTNTQDLKEVKKIGGKVKNEVNKLYKMVEIDIDGIFKSMLLLKKKKYAAVLVDVKDDGSVVERMEMKGLDIVRRDWCDLAKDAGKYVLNEILSANQRDKILENIHDYLTKLRERLESGQVEPEKFEIHKSLTKNPDEYPDKKSLPHVTVALRLMSQGRRVAVGDTISYVICEDSSNLPSSQRAYHPDECVKNNLTIDLKYYLSNQVHPVVSRLCDPIEGTDAAHLATCLGLDGSQYKTSSNQHHDHADTALTVLMSEEERFRDVDKFPVQCVNKSCKRLKESIEFKGSFDSTDNNPMACSECKTNFDVNRMINALHLFIRKKVSKYYACWLSCDDPMCGHVSRHISVKSFKSQHQCQQCRKGNLQPEYTDAALYNQLFYLVRLFDMKRSVKYGESTQEQMSKLHGIANKALSNNAYSTICLKSLFT